MVRRFEPYHETEDPKEWRLAVVRLHSEGWAPRSIASYLGAHRSTVYRVLRRWVEGIDGLEDRPHGRPPASGCADGSRARSHARRPNGGGRQVGRGAAAERQSGSVCTGGNVSPTVPRSSLQMMVHSRPTSPP